MLKHLMKFLSDLFMGPDGETWAIGRIYSIPVLFTGLSLPVMSLLRDHPLSFSEVGVLLGATAAAVTALISLTNHVDNPLPLPAVPTEPKQ